MRIRTALRAELLVVLFAAVFTLGALVTYAQPAVPSAGGAGTGMAQRGAEIYQREHCIFCHSVRDNPAAPVRASFGLSYLDRLVSGWTQNGPDLSQLGERTDDYILAHLVDPNASAGGSSMPSYAYLPDDELRALVAFIRVNSPFTLTVTSNAVQLERPAVPATRESYLAGRVLYATYCSGCHGQQGNGAGTVGHMLQPEPRNFTDAAWMRKRDDDYMFRVIDQGKANTAMPGYGQTLSTRQEALVLFYLKFFANPSARQAMEEGFSP